MLAFEGADQCPRIRVTHIVADQQTEIIEVPDDDWDIQLVQLSADDGIAVEAGMILGENGVGPELDGCRKDSCEHPLGIILGQRNGHNDMTESAQGRRHLHLEMKRRVDDQKPVWRAQEFAIRKMSLKRHVPALNEICRAANVCCFTRNGI